MTTPATATRPDGPRTTARRRWVRLAALVLVPLLLAGALLATAWGRDARTGRIEAAVVNSDQAVTVKGQVVPMGRQLAAAIVAHPTANVNWTLSDPADAAKGLASGRYAAVVTIPKDFSKAATSFASASTATHAVVDVATSPASSVQDAEIARQVAVVAQQSLNQTLTGGYLDNIYVGFNTMGQQLVTMGNGAQQLADGATQLDGGIGRASEGTAQLATGMAELDANGTKLTDGANGLADGATKLSSGVAAYTAGASKLAGGTGQLSDGLAKLDQGLRSSSSAGQFGQLDQLRDGAAQLAAGTKGVSDGLVAYQGQLDRWTSGRDAVPQQVTTAFDAGFAAQCRAQVAQQGKDAAARIGAALTDDVRAQVAAAVQQAVDAYQKASPTPLTPAQLAELTAQLDRALSTKALEQALADPRLAAQVAEQVCPQVATAARPVFTAGFRAGTGTASAALDVEDARSGQSLKGGAAAVAGGAAQLSSGVAQLVDELPRKVAEQTKQLGDAVAQLAAGARALDDGAHQLAAGGPALASGAAQLATGAHTYADGVGQYTAGVAKASSGAQDLASGMTQLDAGSGKLATGLGTFAGKVKEGAAQVPSYSQADRQKLSDVVAHPVTGAVAQGPAPLAQLTTLVLVLGSWLGSLLVWAVARPVPPRVLASSQPSWRLAASTMLPGAAVAAAQAVLLALLGARALHLGAGRTLGLVVLLVLAGLAFSAVNHALAAWLGWGGRLVSLLLATATAAVGVVSAVPPAIATVHQASPLAPALAGVRAIAARTTVGAGPVFALMVLGLVGAVAVLLDVVRRRRLSAEAYLRRGLPVD